MVSPIWTAKLPDVQLRLREVSGRGKQLITVTFSLRLRDGLFFSPCSSDVVLAAATFSVDGPEASLGRMEPG